MKVKLSGQKYRYRESILGSRASAPITITVKDDKPVDSSTRLPKTRAIMAGNIYYNAEAS